MHHSRLHRFAEPEQTKVHCVKSETFLQCPEKTSPTKTVNSKERQETEKTCTLRQMPVYLQNPLNNKKVKVNSLLDNCANATSLDYSVARKLGLDGMKMSITSMGVAGLTHTADAMMALVEIVSLDGKTRELCPVRCTDSPTGPLKFFDWRKVQDQHSGLENIPLPEPADTDQIDMIIGNDLACLMKLETEQPGPFQIGGEMFMSPLAERTVLGWTISGYTDPIPPKTSDILTGRVFLQDGVVALHKHLDLRPVRGWSCPKIWSETSSGGCRRDGLLALQTGPPLPKGVSVQNVANGVFSPPSCPAQIPEPISVSDPLKGGKSSENCDLEGVLQTGPALSKQGATVRGTALEVFTPSEGESGRGSDGQERLLALQTGPPLTKGVSVLSGAARVSSLPLKENHEALCEELSSPLPHSAQWALKTGPPLTTGALGRSSENVTKLQNLKMSKLIPQIVNKMAEMNENIKQHWRMNRFDSVGEQSEDEDSVNWNYCPDEYLKIDLGWLSTLQQLVTFAQVMLTPKENLRAHVMAQMTNLRKAQQARQCKLHIVKWELNNNS